MQSKSGKGLAGNLAHQLQAFRLLDFCNRSRGAGVNTDGQYHGDRVGEPGQIDAFPLPLRLERAG